MTGAWGWVNNTPLHFQAPGKRQPLSPPPHPQTPLPLALCAPCGKPGRTCTSGNQEAFPPRLPGRFLSPHLQTTLVFPFSPNQSMSLLSTPPASQVESVGRARRKLRIIDAPAPAPLRGWSCFYLCLSCRRAWPWGLGPTWQINNRTRLSGP